MATAVDAEHPPIVVTLGLYWGYMGIVEKNMETTIMGYIGFRVQGGIGVREEYIGCRVNTKSAMTVSTLEN